ncbi:MAG: adenylyl-sulfate kinase [Desulfatibacillaceae bacterium]|nr:adenylyl-sulfate kinase [Desulfatibacillaceae bacterium]
MGANTILPHGDRLVSLLVSDEKGPYLLDQAQHLENVRLNSRQVCDLELFACGAFSPLTGFMDEKQCNSVLENKCLPDGLFWPLPVVLDVSQETAARLKPGKKAALRDKEGFVLGILAVTDIFVPDVSVWLSALFGAGDPAHPAARRLIQGTKPVFVGGTLECVRTPLHYSFTDLRFTPAQTRQAFGQKNWTRVIGLDPSAIMHRAEFESTARLMQEKDAALMIGACVVEDGFNDFKTHTQIRCLKKIVKRYPAPAPFLCVVPYFERMAGLRELFLQAIVFKNFGCNAFAVDQRRLDKITDGPCSTQGLEQAFAKNLNMGFVVSPKLVYCQEQETFLPLQQAPECSRQNIFEQDQVKNLLLSGKSLPTWFSFPEIEQELKRAYPPRKRQGFAVFCTGLSGAGKSTLAKLLYAHFMENDSRPVTLLDGDIVRLHLSRELGFSEEHRKINVERIGFVASEIVKNGGIAVCASIAPRNAPRLAARRMVEAYGGFVEVFVSTPLEVCTQRDPKGMYAKAKAGIIKGFTGVDDAYEAPQNPEVVIDTTCIHPEKAMEAILGHLADAGYLDS